MNARLKKKILAHKPLTTEELGDWLLWSIGQWSEEEKAAARDHLEKNLLLNQKCSPVVN